MNIDDITDKDGKVVAFQIDNFFLGRRTLCEFVIKTIPGVHIKRMPCIFSWFRELEFCEFELQGVSFVVKVRPGLSSWFWVGTTPTRWCPQLDLVKDAFRQYDPLGDCSG